MENEQKSAFGEISPTGLILIFIGVTYAVLVLVQLWWEDVFTAEMFWKITVTYGVIGAVVVGVLLIRREFVDSKKMKEDKYID